EVVVGGNPGVVGLRFDDAGQARGHVGQHEVLFVLQTVHSAYGQQARVASPVHAHDVLVGFGADIHPGRFFGGDVVHADADHGVGLAGLRILVLHLAGVVAV